MSIFSNSNNLLQAWLAHPISLGSPAAGDLCDCHQEQQRDVVQRGATPVPGSRAGEAGDGGFPPPFGAEVRLGARRARLSSVLPLPRVPQAPAHQDPSYHRVKPLHIALLICYVQM